MKFSRDMGTHITVMRCGHIEIQEFTATGIKTRRYKDMDEVLLRMLDIIQNKLAAICNKKKTTE